MPTGKMLIFVVTLRILWPNFLRVIRHNANLSINAQKWNRIQIGNEEAGFRVAAIVSVVET